MKTNEQPTSDELKALAHKLDRLTVDLPEVSWGEYNTALIEAARHLRDYADTLAECERLQRCIEICEAKNVELEACLPGPQPIN